MVANRLIPNGFVGAALSCEDGVLRLDRLIGAGQSRDPEELGEELAAEHAVVLELLIAADEGVRIAICVEFKAAEKVGPQSGHTSNRKAGSTSTRTEFSG